MKKQTYAIMFSIVFGVMLSVATGEEKKPEVSKSKILTLFHQLRTAKTQNSVEKILGKPISPPLVRKDGSSQCWYIDKPERVIQRHESPWGIGGIVVEYDKNQKVISSHFNFQWVEEKNIQEYVRKHGTEQAAAPNP